MIAVCSRHYSSNYEQQLVSCEAFICVPCVFTDACMPCVKRIKVPKTGQFNNI